MRTKLIIVISLTLLQALSISNTIAENSSQPVLRPYRVLVVIGNQWNDPGSYRIDEQTQLGGRSSGSNKDFRDIITMLKIWGIPFDILRLDQQRLQINRFLNGTAELNYSCLIWMANPDCLKDSLLIIKPFAVP